MPLLVQRMLRGAMPASLDDQRPPTRQAQPQHIVFGVRPGHSPSTLPPVRIFIGTERQQFRAERTLLWSIEQHRDPSRLYEIYLLRDLLGFRRRLWLTGFTNYRFAIPDLCDYQGRAIYNDADQVYLSDPAELFDTPMEGAGFLAINDRDTSVMLMDCKLMADAWEAGAVRRLSRKALEARARNAGLWGSLRGTWNTRDREYDPATADLVHFTTLQTQPWRPFPDQFVYFDNPTGDLWGTLEAQADRHGFQAVTARQPSAEWPVTLSRLTARSDGARLQEIFGPEAPARQPEPLRIVRVLETISDQDLPWVLERLFRYASRLELNLDEPTVQSAGSLRRSEWFWLQQVELAGRQHPDTPWQLLRRSRSGRVREFNGGPVEPGSIVALTHRKPGHSHQARAIAQGLARHTQREFREVATQISEVRFLVDLCLGRHPAVKLPDDARVLVASAWLPGLLARRLARRRPQLRLVLSGRKAGPPPEQAGVVIQCAHFNLPPHPNRMVTTLPLNAGAVDTTRDAQSWQEWLEAPKRCALLLGGSSRAHELSTADARHLVSQVSAWSQRHGARLLVVTGRRSVPLTDDLADAVGPDGLLYRWAPDDPANPYQLALQYAQQLVVTGESESMLADAVAQGRRFQIWPVSPRRPTIWSRFSAAVARRAVHQRTNARGSIRPQQGLTYLCARAVERGWILPPRDLASLHERLYSQGVATPFLPSAAFEDTADAGFDAADETRGVLAAIADRLGLMPAQHTGEPVRAGQNCAESRHVDPDYGMKARLNQGT